MRAQGLLPIGLLLAGAALVGYAVVQGGATVSLLLIVPVVTGRSVEFLAGVVLLLLGFVLLPLLWPGEFATREEPSAVSPAAPSEGTSVAGGGLLLIGPVPIFFGGWRQIPLSARVAVAVAGALVVVVLVLLAVGVLG